jgi:hypothetical protein
LKIRLEDDSRVERLDLAEYGALEVLQGTTGYVRSSVFAHALGYRRGSTIWWEGNEKEPSAGNAFLHVSSITPQWKSRWNHAGPLWLVGWDCESWNGVGKGDTNCFEVANSPSLISMGLSGGTVYGTADGALASITNVPLVADFSSRPRGGNAENADVIFDRVGDNYSVFRAAFRLVDRSPVGPRTGDFAVDPSPLAVATPVVGPSAAVRELLQRHEFPAIPGPLETGVFALPPSASLSVSTLADGSAVVDQAAFLQRLIDRDGVARITPGVYRLSHPLQLGSVERIEGLVAAAPGEVVLVAGGDFPVIQGRRSSAGDKPAQLSVVLSGVALVGGNYGIYWSAEPGNFGAGMTVAHSTFEHLRFTGQSVAGVAALGIAGIDSNSWRRVLFEALPIAVLGAGKGAQLGMNYADKQGFMLCTFRQVREAVWSWDSERPSGGNFWYRSAFEQVGAVSRTRAAYNLIWFGSTFKDVGATRGLSMLDYGTTATGDFFVISSRWSGRGPAAVTDTASWGVGTYLLGSEFLQQEGGLVGSRDSDTLLVWGSRVGVDGRDGLPAKHLVINTLWSGVRAGFELGSRQPSAQ